MRPESSRKPGARSNALWGKSTRGNETRSSALWGKGNRGFVALVVLAVALVLPVSGLAGSSPVKNDVSGVVGSASGNDKVTAVVPAELIAQAQANPGQLFHVIVQGTSGDKRKGTKGNSSNDVANDVNNQIQGDNQNNQNGNGDHAKLTKTFLSISGVAADLTGKELLKLARNPHVLAITPDAPVASTGLTAPLAAVPATPAVVPATPAAVPATPAAVPATPDSSMWAVSTHVDMLWKSFDPWTGRVLGPAPQAPAIAIVDSGIDASKVNDFGARVVAQVNLSSLDPTGTGDGEGHGTMVAGLAAGQSPAYPGAAQNAPIVDIRTADANGQSRTSDVIAGADWILAHKAEYNIKVANFSMASANSTSFRFDPLDKAVERLWFNGVVVVAAAGNHGTGTAVDMSHAPGNDPFVITVGALDQQETSDPLDDTVPSWSAYGNTMDGFSKPDLAAPGRYRVAPVPMNSTIATTVPERVVAPGYIWMSGTSFAAPIVAGAAAQILARHPDWGPNEVKGSLMLTSAYLAGVAPQPAGVGEIDAGTAASLDFVPPNPNENLDAFIVTDPATGTPVFDQAAWSSAVQAAASWSSAAWSSAAWSSAAWSSAAWSSAAWSSASFTPDVTGAMRSLASWSR